MKYRKANIRAKGLPRFIPALRSPFLFELAEKDMSIGMRQRARLSCWSRRCHR